MSDAIGVLERISLWSPYFRVSTGPADDRWRPTADLADPATRDVLVADMAARIGTAEPRVAGIDPFFGYVARVWSVAIGSTSTPDGVSGSIPSCSCGGTLAGCTCTSPNRISVTVSPWRCSTGRSDRSSTHGPTRPQPDCWGNTASALIGAGRVIGSAAGPHVDSLLSDPRLADAIDPATGRRRSCCLYYRTPTGGVCGDCVFPTPPKDLSKEIP